MKAILLVLLGVILIGIVVVFQYDDSSSPSKSSVGLPSQGSLPQSQIQDDQAGAIQPSQAELVGGSALSESKDKLLVFPDGEVLEVKWRKHKQPTVSQYGVDNYEILREAALTGDAIASIMLYEMQRSCQSRYESEDELEAALDQLYQTHTIPIPGREQPAGLGDPERIDRMEAQMRSKYSRCKKLLAYQGNLEEKWLERSANDGWPLAMIELGQQQEDQESARILYQAAWDAGSTQSLDLLSEIIRQSYENGVDPSANVEAFAMLRTYTIIETTLLKNQGRIAGRQAARLQAKLDEEQKLLLPQELEEALEMSKQMIRSNPNCCFGL